MNKQQDGYKVLRTRYYDPDKHAFTGNIDNLPRSGSLCGPGDGVRGTGKMDNEQCRMDNLPRSESLPLTSGMTPFGFAQGDKNKALNFQVSAPLDLFLWDVSFLQAAFS